MSQVVTRIAPSPTGYMHIGTARTALFNWLYARGRGGKFLLRIEDTDQKRSTPESEKAILDALRWTGLSWDEGPDIGGDSGPYRQSERRAEYDLHCQILLEAGHAFHCFCTPAELDAMRAEQMAAKQTPRYDGRCTHLDAAEVDARIARGDDHVVRMRVPTDGECSILDRLRGLIQIPWAQVDMQILIKADGLPTYHLANVVDDHLMGITHVIRGEEWIPSAPKHQLLYQYFGWEMPELCHLPLLRNPDQSKLSKRKNPTSINYYQDMGYLPEALVNYLGMMGWSMPGGEEKFSLAEMEAAFDISRVSLGGPIFDIEKLDWLNGRYLREDLNDADFASRFVVWASKDDRLHKIIPLIKPRVERFSDVVGLASQFIDGVVPLTPAQFEHKALSQDQCLRILQFSLWRLESLSEWDRDAIETAMQTLAAQLDLKIRDFLFPLFVAISGKAVSTSIMDSLAILGLDVARARLRNALSVLGGVSKKLAKNLDKEYRVLGQAEQPD